MSHVFVLELIKGKGKTPDPKNKKELIKMAGPIERKTTGYGEGKVLSLCKWEEGNITLEVREQEDGEWETTNKIVLYEAAQKVLKEMMGSG